MLGSEVEPLARRGAEAVDVVVNVFHGFAERRDDGLVGAEFNDLAELLRCDLLGFLHFPGAVGQRCWLREANRSGPWLARLALSAASCRLAARRGMSRPLEIDHGLAEMPEHHAGAGADDDRHAGDRGEGGKQAAFDAPMGTQKARMREHIFR